MNIKPRTLDRLIRLLFISAGLLSATLFTLHGQGEVLPPLALGGLLGACLVTGLGANEDHGDGEENPPLD